MAKGDDQRNPITGLQPNQFTNVTNRELPAPRNVREVAKSPDAARLRKQHTQGVADVVKPQVGYQRPEGMEPRDFSWLTGGHHMFPNQQAQAGTPAINEPHEAHPGVTVQRRAEDLSGPEYRKGEATLRNYGYGRKPVEELTDIHRSNIERVIGEHAASGVNESASQHFYGGAPVTTHISDPELQRAHTQGIQAAHNRFETGAASLANHEQFKGRTPDLTDDERHQGARNVMAQATADTSPNAKWRTGGGDRWPNMEQAEESATAGLEGRKPKFVTGRVQNHAKAADRTVEMTANHGSEQFAAHGYGDPVSAPKTIAFRGALSEPNAPDSYKVSDIHEAGSILPGATTAKSLGYVNGEGKRFYQHPDDPKSRLKGATPYMNPKTGKQDTGNARAESMLSDSGSTVHALNDHATRRALSDYGLSRGVNHSDNIHAEQGAAWGSQQVHRADVEVSHASQYPVVRNWAGEGHTELNDLGKQAFGDSAPTHMGAQFTRNPNTRGMDKSGQNRQDVHRVKPYPVMPGEA